MFALNAATVATLSRELDTCALRHQIYSANIANADVQGYQRLEVTEDLSVINNNVVDDPAIAGAFSGQVRSTNESVKLDQELAKLSKNALRYETLLTAYEKTASILNLAVREGREG